jgi:hypothetical protein
VQKNVLYQMSVSIQVFIVLALLFSVLFGRYDYLHLRLFRFPDDFVCVVTPVRQQTLRFYPFDQLQSLCTVRCGTLRNKNSDRHTMRIHGQVYLAVEPPFVTAIPWLPPRAPLASGCTLM